jgi:predicted nucleotidyltransferase
MELKWSASGLFGDKNAWKVLKFFLENQKSKKSLAQLEREVSLSRVSISRGLRKLKGAGLLSEERVGRSILYFPDNSNPILKELKKLLMVSYLYEAFREYRKAGFEAYLFGSCARGENDEKSDIDMLIIAENKEEAKGLLKTLKDERLKPLIMGKMEYASLSRKDRPFYERVEKDRIRVA